MNVRDAGVRNADAINVMATRVVAFVAVASMFLGFNRKATVSGAIIAIPASVGSAVMTSMAMPCISGAGWSVSLRRMG